jgi:FeS assembly SUF system regulator
MIRVSRLADYGIGLMTQIASAQHVLHSAHSLSASMNLPLPTVSKLLSALARGGLLVATRGARGGYKLGAEPAQISVADIIQAVDGPIALTECLENGPGSCDLEIICPSRRGWSVINDAITRSLASVTLADFGGFGDASPQPRRETLEPVVHGY